MFRQERGRTWRTVQIQPVASGRLERSRTRFTRRTETAATRQRRGPPNDSVVQGKQLRLEQQYFFVSCSLQDMLRLHLRGGDPIDRFHEHFAAQLNDTHPAIAVAELMRLLVDEHQLAWDTAWDVTRRTFAYTNHTLLSEALEQWPLSLFAALLPRHLDRYEHHTITE